MNNEEEITWEQFESIMEEIASAKETLKSDKRFLSKFFTELIHEKFPESKDKTFKFHKKLSLSQYSTGNYFIQCGPFLLSDDNCIAGPYEINWSSDYLNGITPYLWFSRLRRKIENGMKFEVKLN